MKLDYPKIKKFLQIGIFSIDIVVFLLVIFSTNSSSENYKEYTDASKFFLDVYILAIYAILILVTVMPGLIYYRVKKYIIFIFTDKGKVIISFAISLIYWFARNKPQFVLGVILTLTSIVLLIYEFIFHCAKVETFLNNKGIEFSNKGQSTFDMNALERKLNSNMTPESSKSSDYQNNQSSGNSNKNSSGNSGDFDHNQQNPTPNNYQGDVEISSGIDDNNKPNNNMGFGF
jgi:hypothetical protein